MGTLKSFALFHSHSCILHSLLIIYLIFISIHTDGPILQPFFSLLLPCRQYRSLSDATVCTAVLAKSLLHIFDFSFRSCIDLLNYSWRCPEDWVFTAVTCNMVIQCTWWENLVILYLLNHVYMRDLQTGIRGGPEHVVTFMYFAFKKWRQF